MNYWYPVKEELILASKSPRRTEILTFAAVPHLVKPSNVDEFPLEGSPEEIVQHWAVAKASDITGKFPDRPVLGADTMVFQSNKLLGKPNDKEEAFKMLSSLSGEWHTVFGGVALFWKSRNISFVFAEPTRVKFRELSSEEIWAYIATGEPMDKAGSYGIQGQGSVLVERIEGCYFNVMGLPVARFLQRFKDSIS